MACTSLVCLAEAYSYAVPFQGIVSLPWPYSPKVCPAYKRVFAAVVVVSLVTRTNPEFTVEPTAVLASQPILFGIIVAVFDTPPYAPATAAQSIAGPVYAAGFVGAHGLFGTETGC